MAIRMKEWGMLAAPGQAVHVPTQGLRGWERVGRSMGEGLGDVLMGGLKLAEMAQVNRAGELASFTQQLRSISAEVADELREEPVKDWEYAWQTAISPRVSEAVQSLSAEARESGAELARAYVSQASIEAQRDRELQRVASARQRWQQQVEASVSAGEDAQAARWVEAGRGVFVPEAELEARVKEARSRACHSRWESRLQANPMQTLVEWGEAGKQAGTPALPARREERELLEQSCARSRRALRQQLAQEVSAALRAGEEIEPATWQLAARAGVSGHPSLSAPAGAKGEPPSVSTRSAWRRWVDSRADGEEDEQKTRLSIASAPLPLEERRCLLERLERSVHVPAADRRALSNRLFALYNSGAFGCPGDAEARRSLLALQEEGLSLLAGQGAEAASAWVQARGAGAEGWVCFEADTREG